jgi:hypothetical protein
LNIQSPLSLRERVRVGAFKKFNFMAALKYKSLMSVALGHGEHP